MNPRITLDQWRAFIAVVDEGGYAQAAETLHLSQSTVSYAVARLQELLGMQVLAVSGRKAELTPAGKMLLPRARQLVADAVGLESSAAAFLQGRETEITLVTDLLCPTSLLLNALKRFQPFHQTTGVLIREEVLSGTEELLQSGQAHLGIHSRIPPGCTGEVLIDVEFIPVSHPQHELQTLGRPIDIKDLARATQIFIRDTGTTGKQLNDAMNYSPQRWTVSSRETALEMLRQGFGFCWTPRHWIEEDLAAGGLRPLPLEPNEQRRIPLYLVFPGDKQIGPATRELATCIRQENAG